LLVVGRVVSHLLQRGHKRRVGGKGVSSRSGPHQKTALAEQTACIGDVFEFRRARRSQHGQGESAEAIEGHIAAVGPIAKTIRSANDKVDLIQGKTRPEFPAGVPIFGESQQCRGRHHAEDHHREGEVFRVAVHLNDPGLL